MPRRGSRIWPRSAILVRYSTSPIRNPTKNHERMLPFSAVNTEATMKVEIIERKLTTVVTFSIPNVQLGVAIALAAVAVGLVAFILLLIREFNEWASGQGSMD
jgi:hypothetical protein